MCLSEALLRIPDSHTIDALIADKLATGNWEKHLGESNSLFVNASIWVLNQIVHEGTNIEEIVIDPISITDNPVREIRHPKIPLPARLFGKGRLNSAGINLANNDELQSLLQQVNSAPNINWSATPIINGYIVPAIKQVVSNPTNGKSFDHLDAIQPTSISKAIDVAAAAGLGRLEQDACQRTGSDTETHRRLI